MYGVMFCSDGTSGYCRRKDKGRNKSGLSDLNRFRVVTVLVQLLLLCSEDVDITLGMESILSSQM